MIMMIRRALGGALIRAGQRLAPPPRVTISLTGGDNVLTGTFPGAMRRALVDLERGAR